MKQYKVKDGQSLVMPNGQVKQAGELISLPDDVALSLDDKVDFNSEIETKSAKSSTESKDSANESTDKTAKDVKAK